MTSQHWAPFLNALIVASLVFLHFSFSRLLFRQDRAQSLFFLRLSLAWSFNLIYILSLLIIHDISLAQSFLIQSTTNTLASLCFLLSARWRFRDKPYLRTNVVIFVSVFAMAVPFLCHFTKLPLLLLGTPSILLGMAGLFAVGASYHQFLMRNPSYLPRWNHGVLEWSLYLYAALQLGAFGTPPFNDVTIPGLLSALFAVGLLLKASYCVAIIAYAERVVASYDAQASLLRQARLSVRLADQMAHELRTPSAELKLRLQSALAAGVPPTSHEILNTLEQISGLIDVFQRLQDDQRIDGQLSVSPDVYNLNNVCDAVIVSIKMTSRPRCAFRKAYAAGPTVEAIESELFQVVRNLVKNAVEALAVYDRRSRSGVDEICLQTVVDRSSTEVQLIVSDNGPGVPKEIRHHIFEEGFSTKGGKGRGYGLHIVKTICDNNSWKIRCVGDSQDGMSGAHFVVSFPYKDRQRGRAA